LRFWPDFPGRRVPRRLGGLIFPVEIGYPAQTGHPVRFLGSIAVMARVTDIAAYSAPLKSPRDGALASKLLLSLLLTGPWAA